MKILTKLCVVCGEEFIKPVNESLKNWLNRHKYCSRSCLAKYTYHLKLKKHQFSKERHYIPPTAFKKGQRPSPSTEFKKGQVTWNKDRPWTIEERQKISDTSYWKGRTGELSPNWKGGTTKLGQLIRSCNLNKIWRTEVFQRDNWTCVSCGAKRSKGNRVIIHCDHIKPFYKILEENNIKTVEEAKNCKELWDIENGRTLCIPCHKQTPSYLVNQHTK